MAIIRVVGRLGILDPEQIALLQDIFDSACARLALDPKSQEAAKILLKNWSPLISRVPLINSYFLRD